MVCVGPTTHCPPFERETSTSRQCGFARTASNERSRLTYRSSSNSWESEKRRGRGGTAIIVGVVVGTPPFSTSPPSRSLFKLLFLGLFAFCSPAPSYFLPNPFLPSPTLIPTTLSFYLLSPFLSNSLEVRSASFNFSADGLLPSVGVPSRWKSRA